MDYRQGSRRRALVLIEIHWLDGKSTAGLIYDIGFNGMFVLSETLPKAHECVDIVMTAAGNRLIRIPGLVIHQRNHGFGLLFRRLDTSTRAFVEKYLD
jgi:hypothetical protein